MDWRRRDCEVQVIPNLCEMNRPGCGTTTTDCHRHGLHHRTAASNATSATSSTGRRVVKTVMARTVCIGVRVCDEWSLARFVEYYLRSSTRVYVNGMLSRLQQWTEWNIMVVTCIWCCVRESESVSGSPRAHVWEHAVCDCWGTACTYVWVRGARCY